MARIVEQAFIAILKFSRSKYRWKIKISLKKKTVRELSCANKSRGIFQYVLNKSKTISLCWAEQNVEVPEEFIFFDKFSHARIRRKKGLREKCFGIFWQWELVSTTISLLSYVSMKKKLSEISDLYSGILKWNEPCWKILPLRPQ